VTLSYTGSYERPQQFRCLEITLRSQNSFRGEIKSRLKSGIACCHSVQDLLSYSFLSKNIRIEMYRNIILPVVLCGCETWSLTLREKSRLMLFENRVPRKVFEPKKTR
jgi:hypothetical protein